MSRRDDRVPLRPMLDHATEAVELARNRRRWEDLGPHDPGQGAARFRQKTGDSKSGEGGEIDGGEATSNNARSRFGSPKSKGAKFAYEGGLLELEAAMNYR